MIFQWESFRDGMVSRKITAGMNDQCLNLILWTIIPLHNFYSLPGVGKHQTKFWNHHHADIVIWSWRFWAPGMMKIPSVWKMKKKYDNLFDYLNLRPVCNVIRYLARAFPFCEPLQTEICGPNSQWYKTSESFQSLIRESPAVALGLERTWTANINVNDNCELSCWIPWTF